MEQPPNLSDLISERLSEFRSELQRQGKGNRSLFAREAGESAVITIAIAILLHRTDTSLEAISLWTELFKNRLEKSEVPEQVKKEAAKGADIQLKALSSVLKGIEKLLS